MIEQPLLLIFDIDGTLSDSAGLPRIAFDAAAEEIYRIREATMNIKAAGRTDQQIFNEMLSRHSLPRTDFIRQFNEFSSVYANKLHSLMDESDAPKLNKGVLNLVNNLSNQHIFHLALGTGNIEASAYIKLKRLGIDCFFPVGGFGDVSFDRKEIIHIALERAREHYRIEFQEDDAWVIGDTPFDIEAGRALGMNTLAVSTGQFTQIELIRYRPSALFPDLDDWERFLEVVSGKVKLASSPVREIQSTQ